MFSKNYLVKAAFSFFSIFTLTISLSFAQIQTKNSPTIDQHQISEKAVYELFPTQNV